MMKFALGQTVATPAALTTLHEAGVNPATLIARHVSGDFGDVCDEDKARNQDAIHEGTRILSAYNLANGESVWIVTEWDRSATTLLLPLEY